MTFLVFISVQKEQHRFIGNELEAQVISQAKILAVSSEVFMSSGNAENIQGLLDAQTDFEVIIGMSVLSAEGDVVARSGKNQNDSDLEELIAHKTSSGISIYLAAPPNMIDIAVPLMVADQLAGWMRLTALKPVPQMEMQPEILKGIGWIVVSFILGALLIYASTQNIAKSMLLMRDVANRFRAGERDLRIELKRGDTLDQLGQSFNALADTVNEREAELFHQREHLEEVVLERTRDLVHEVREKQAAEEQVKLIVNSALDGIVSADANGNILSCNPAGARMFGYVDEELAGQNFSVLLPISLTTKNPDVIQSLLKSASSDAQVTSGSEFQAVRKNGEAFPMEVSISQYTDREQNFFTAVVRDITARKEAETRLRDTLETLKLTQNELVQSGKMASLGGLVAGVAHEINTPIGVGVTAASHLHEKSLELAKSFEEGVLNKRDFKVFLNSAIEATQIILTNLSRGSDLIKSFKQVAVDQSSEASRKFLLLDYIQEVLVSLRPQLKHYGHQITLEGDRDLRVESYPGPIAQIITNLIMNSALHAFDPGEKGQITISADVDADTVCLTYRDNGKGMDAETVSKVFDPFFTTQRGTGGSGLGMHILYNQVTQTLGGSVKCSSEPGEGATFVFMFPVRKGN